MTKINAFCLFFGTVAFLLVWNQRQTAREDAKMAFQYIFYKLHKVFDRLSR